MCITLFTIADFPNTNLYSFAGFSGPFSDLPKQDRALIRDLIMINYPPTDWRKDLRDCKLDPKFDVVIVGAGMAGLTAAAALFKEGIFHIKLFDQNPKGREGPWTTHARMCTLRSKKDIVGPALDIPHLTFHAWFDSMFGAEAWKKLVKIPNQMWMDYLSWYRQAMGLPIENQCKLVRLTPLEEGGFELEFMQENKPLIVKARKVILATGRSGFGGPLLPNFVNNLPRSTYAHTDQPIDFKALKGRSIGIIGAGASAFDSAAVALETEASHVDIIVRRGRIPNVNKFASLPYKGFSHGYFQLADEKRWEFMCSAFEAGIPPPWEALKRVEKYSNLRLLTNRKIQKVSYKGSKVHVETSKGTYSYDFLVLGTGYCIDGRQQPELKNVIDLISLWKDHLPQDIVNKYPDLGNFPYLGPSFEFLPKQKGEASFLKDLYCYNYGATLSHGILSNDIPGISIGATRLAQGIAVDFFCENSDWYLDCLKKYSISDFEQEDYLRNIE